MTYKLLLDLETSQVRLDTILRIDDEGIHSFIPNEVKNRDWVEYQAWLALGNEPA